MPQEKPETIWLRTEFAFPSSDRCQCYKHRAKTGKTKRWPNRDSVIGLETRNAKTRICGRFA